MKKLTIITFLVVMLSGCAALEQMFKPPALPEGPHSQMWFTQELAIKAIDVLKESEAGGVYDADTLARYKSAVCRVQNANGIMMTALAVGDLTTVDGQIQAINAVLAEIQQELIPLAQDRAVTMQRSRAISPGMAQGILAGIQLFTTWMEMKQEAQQAASDGIGLEDVQQNVLEINSGLAGYCA